jgi:NADPH:quinone reductase-like Zn-dependent oxidoreductase
MKAFVVGRYGSEAGVRMREVPEPDVGEHDVLVEVRAASVNPLDAKIRDGEFKLILPYRVPFVLGHDMAGEVVRVGSAVRSFAPGDAVYGPAPQGPHRHLRRVDRCPRGRPRSRAVHPHHGGGRRATSSR